MELSGFSTDTDNTSNEDEDIDRLQKLIKSKSECLDLEKIFPFEQESEKESTSDSSYSEDDSDTFQELDIVEKTFPSEEDTNDSDRVCASISSAEEDNYDLEEFFKSKSNYEIFDILNQVYSSDNDSSDEESTKEKEGDIQDEDNVRWNLASCKTFAGLPIESVHDGDKIKIGQRVVRGKDWYRGDQDGGEGNVGTVVKIINQGKVEVLWDCRDETYLYATGEGRKYDLRLYDNAQTGAKHRRFRCDMCNEFPIRGMKWRCRECEDYDLCSMCYMENEHDQKHIFERRQDNASMNIEVGPRVGLQYIPAYGVFPYQFVRYRDNPKKKGKVHDFDEENVRFFKCDAKVEWPDEESVTRYPVGREGKSDLVCWECPNGVYYYDDHLPLISAENAKIGLRVVRVTNEDESDVGTIVSIQTTDLKEQHYTEMSTEKAELYVKWDFQEQEEPHKFDELKLFDNSQAGINHLAICSICNDKLLVGMRWHCIDCDDYDLCTLCYMSDHDDKKHEYFRIQEQSQEGVFKPFTWSRFSVISSVWMYPTLPLCTFGSDKNKRFPPQEKMLQGNATS